MIPSMKTTAIYADLQLYCNNKAVVLLHSNLWIASLAKEGGGIQMASDKDLSALKEPLTEKLFYVPIS